MRVDMKGWAVYTDVKSNKAKNLSINFSLNYK